MPKKDKDNEIKIQAETSYNGHSIKANGSVDISFKFGYSELTNVIKLLQLLNENIKIAVKIRKENPIVVGEFMLKDFRIDSDGESTIKFNSSVDYIEGDILGLVGEPLKVMFKAKLGE